MRTPYKSDTIESEKYKQLLNFYSKQFDRSQEEENDDNLRYKRFFPLHVNIGCVKGYKCCENSRCKPFCSLCYSKFLYYFWYSLSNFGKFNVFGCNS